MRNIFCKSLFIFLGCFVATSVWAQYPTPIANLNFEITSGQKDVPEGYLYSTTNKPSIKTYQGVSCIIISDGGGSTPPTFNGSNEPSEGKRWMAFCPDVNCSAKITILNKKKFFIQNEDGEFFSHTNATNNTPEEVTVENLVAGKWYAMCGGSSQVYITKIEFISAGKSKDATLSGITVNDVAISDFSADKTEYEIELPAGTTDVPNVDAKTRSSKATMNITQASSLPGKATITVTAEDGETTKVYTVEFSVASAFPKVKSATWDNIAGSAVIDQANLTITGRVKNGSSLVLTPQFTGDNIKSWTPDSWDFGSNPTTDFEFSAATGEMTTYSITITEAEAANDDASLKKLNYGDKSVPDFSSTTYVYNIELNSGIKTPPAITAEPNDPNAKVEITQAQSVPGSGKVVVTAEDGFTQQTYTVNYTVPVPPSGLTIHRPEVYEAKEIAGGYGGTLSTVKGHEYEVYYASFMESGSLSVTVKPVQKSEGITESLGDYNCKAKDGWFEMKTSTSKSNYSMSATEEFAAGDAAVHKLLNNAYYKMHVKGFDQFSFFGKDNNPDESKGKHFEVYIDNVKQNMTLSNSASIRRFDITTGEHTIEVRGVGASNNEFYGFSLRIAQEPRTKWLKGNDSTQFVLQTAPIAPIHYVTKYNNMSGAETKIEWIGTKAEGIELREINGELSDTLVLEGTANCPVGTYKYAIVAYLNNIETTRAEGKFYVKSDIKSLSDLDIDVYVNEEMDQIKFKYYALSPNDVKLTFSDPQPVGIEGKGENGRYFIGGTPTTIGVFPFQITVTGADTTIIGKVTVKELNYGDNPVLYLYKNQKAYENDGVFKYLSESGKWNPVARKAKEDGDGLRPEDQYSKYKWVLISEDADANSKEVLAVIRGGANLPVLNLKGFTYTKGRLDWGEPDNGAVDSTASKTKGCSITIRRANHPVFAKLGYLENGQKVRILTNYQSHGIMPIAINLPGTMCLSTANTRDLDDYYKESENEQTAIHEIPADMRGGHKYICLPLARDVTLSDQGQKLIEGIVDYLMSSQQAPMESPFLQINEFTVQKHKAIINQDENTITLKLTTKEFNELDSLRAVKPVITLADPVYSYVNPGSEEEVKLTYAAFTPFKYTVTDFISHRDYKLYIQFYSPEGIENIYEAGQWVNIFDVYGRKVATTNEDIYSMELPRGMYIIVTETGQTIKLLR